MIRIQAFAGVMLLGLSTSALATDAIPNWAAPSTWTASPTPAAGRSALVTYPPLPFVPLAPCRLIDTRAGSGFPAGYGPPSLGGGAQRTFTITGQCGVPATAQAVSFNFAVWIPASRGDLRVFPAGGATPTVSTLNWEAGILALANAAVTPLGAGAVTLQLDASTATDFFVDVNGYYSATPGSPFLINGGSFQGGQFHTSGGFEAVDAFCDTADVNCWAYFTNAGAGNFSAVFQAGRGMFTSSSDTGFPGIHGDASFSSGGLFTTSELSGQVGGVVGIAGTAIDNLFNYAGVRGISTSWGTLGISTFFGAGGFRVDGAGVPQSGSYLGFSATDGLHTIGTTSATGVKAFVEPHPTDPTKVIRYVALEGGEAGTYFRGRGRFLKGRAVIAVPEDFRLVTDEEGLTVQITPIGGLANVAVLHANLNEIAVQSSKDVDFYYLVHGVRETFRDFRPADDVNIYYMPDSPIAVMPGSYSAAQKKRLIDNGTYNPDGTVNVLTAERVGWTKIWQARAEAAKNAAAAARAVQAEQRMAH